MARALVPRDVRILLAGICSTLFTLGGSAAALADSAPRVPESFYGINYTSIGDHDALQRALHLNRIANSGIPEIRFTVHWNEIEPNAPTGSTHNYQFTRPDHWVGDAAREGLRSQVSLAYTPHRWNHQIRLECDAAGVSHAPNDLNAYALAIKEMVKRYGRGGSFWAAHPNIPAKPVTTWEVWNEQNLTSYWCPTPDPHRYAEMFALAAQAVNSVDSKATVVIGGMTLASPSGNAKDPGEFLQAMVKHRPAITGLADAVGVHAYPQGSLEQQLDVIALFRLEMQQGGIPDSTPMLVNELGWTTAPNAVNPFTEEERVARYRLMTRDLPRTNCNVSGMIPHAWTTRETNTNQETDFYGIAKPLTGVLYPSGQEFADSIALMLGKRAQEPPTSGIDTCRDMPPLDRDDDGVPDEDDPAPIDPDVPGDGPGPDPSGCSARMIEQTRVVVSTSGAAHDAALKDYKQLRKSCVPGLRRVAKISKKIKAADRPRRRASLRQRRRDIRARIAPCLSELDAIQGEALVQGADVDALTAEHDAVRRDCR